MTRIVTYTHRYKRTRRKRRAAPLDMPAIVRAGEKASPLASKPEPSPANDDRKPAMVTARKPGSRPVAPDLTEEEVQQHGNAAVALWREMMRQLSKPKP